MPLSRTTRPQHNLPAEIASFVGRERELAEITRILARVRLLTLTGAGGSGKTRLALRVAADLAPAFPDGVWLVQLAPVADSSLVPRVVAAAMGIHGSGGQPLLTTLAAALASRRMLLVLDNCEHLIGACARLAETLLRACPDLRVLAASREPLRIAGETIWRVPPLALPQETHLASSDALHALAQVESVALFVARAHARRSDFALTMEHAPSIVAICRQMDGLPLAIELAAAQVSALAPAQIASRLGDALHLLGGGSRTLPRQETLRATLDWSYALLSPAEAALFRRLAVFAGGFDVAAMEGVCSGEIAQKNMLPLLTALVEKSLVEALARPGEARFRLLEPVRQYACARLAPGETDDAWRLHARYFMELAETAQPSLMSANRAPWLERLAADQDNLRAALAWSRHRAEEGDARDSAVGLRLAAALFWFWGIRGEISEGREWLEAALAKGWEAAAGLRAKALYAAGELAWPLGQTSVARERLEASAALYRTLGDKRGLAYVLQALPYVLDQPEASEVAAEALRLFEEIGDPWGAAHTMLTQAFLALDQCRDTAALPTVRERIEEALARWRALGDDWGTAQALNYLGDLARQRDDNAAATAHYQEALALLRRQGITGTVPSLLHNLGYLAVREGATRRALRLFRESLTLFRDQGDQRGVAECLAGIGGALGALKQPERAARLLGASEALFEASGTALSPSNAADYARNLGVVRSQLREAALVAAWADGQALTTAQAIADALDVAHVDGSLGEAHALGLTAREREVAALVARGLTNRQTGQALVITEGTARLHVKHILAKLGFASRAQIAAWAVEQGLAEAPAARPEA